MPPELTAWVTPTAWTGWGLAAGLFILLATGRLIPKSTVDRELARADRTAADWKETAELERKAREVQAEKDDEILSLLRAMNAPTQREPAA